MLVGAFAVLLMAGLPPAQADDRSLREAGRSRDAQFERLGRETRQAFARWTNSGYRPRYARPLIRKLRRARSEVDIVEAAVGREQPSSSGGETYKTKLLQSLRAFDGALLWDIRGVRARTNGRRVRANRAFRRANRLFAKASRLEREAVNAIEQAAR